MTLLDLLSCVRGSTPIKYKSSKKKRWTLTTAGRAWLSMHDGYGDGNEEIASISIDCGMLVIETYGD